MNENGVFYIVVGILIIFFFGEPDLQDALIDWLTAKDLKCN